MQRNNTESNKRIAKNTLIIYARIILTTLIGLLTYRFVLQALGVSDYGLYNVVGGVIGLLGFISGAMSVTTSRFINFEMGKMEGNPNRIFNVCLVIHICLAIFIVIVSETIGIFYIHHYLNIAPGKEGDAMFVFQVSVIVACLGIMNVPYSSLLMAFERFLDVALVDITNTILKLVFVIVLLYYQGNALRFYALSMSLLTFSTFFFYHFIAYKRWPKIVKWRFYTDKPTYKSVLVFNNYNILSSLSVVFRSQGSTMLINFFFGTLVNGAFAVAYSVQQYVLMLTDNIDRAASPQIIQNYSKGDQGRTSDLVFTIGRITTLILELVYFPLALEIGFILKMWLGKVPDGAVTFCQCTLVLALVAATVGGMGQVINASGKIKWFKIEMSVLYLLVIPVGFILFKFGFPPYTILILFILSDVLSRIIQLILMQKLLNFDSWQFVKKAYGRPFFVMLIMLVYSLIYRLLPMGGNLNHSIGFCISFIVTGLIVYCLGLKNNERQRFVRFIEKKIRR